MWLYWNNKRMKMQKGRDTLKKVLSEKIPAYQRVRQFLMKMRQPCHPDKIKSFITNISFDEIEEALASMEEKGEVRKIRHQTYYHNFHDYDWEYNYKKASAMMFENLEYLVEVDRKFFQENYKLDEGANWEKTIYKGVMIETYCDSQKGFVLLITVEGKSYTNYSGSISAESPEIWAINYIDEALDAAKNDQHQ